MATTSEAPAKAWHCENCNKKLAIERGYGTKIECRGCGHLNEA